MKISKIAFYIAVVAALLLFVAGPGTRLGMWDFSMGFMLMRWALFAGLAAAAFALVLLVIPKTRAGNVTMLAAALLVGLGTAWVPWNGYQTATSLPFIHDITTDTVDPRCSLRCCLFAPTRQTHRSILAKRSRSNSARAIRISKHWCLIRQPTRRSARHSRPRRTWAWK